MKGEGERRPGAMLLGVELKPKASPGRASPGRVSIGRDMMNDDEEEGAESDDDEAAEQDAARLFLDAVESKDPAALVEAYHALKSACGG